MNSTLAVKLGIITGVALSVAPILYAMYLEKEIRNDLKRTRLITARTINNTIQSIATETRNLTI